jgi:hypothetical protein
VQVKGAGVEHHDERPTATLVAMATHLLAVPNRIRPGGHGEQGRWSPPAAVAFSSA